MGDWFFARSSSLWPKVTSAEVLANRDCSPATTRVVSSRLLFLVAANRLFLGSREMVQTGAKKYPISLGLECVNTLLLDTFQSLSARKGIRAPSAVAGSARRHDHGGVVRRRERAGHARGGEVREEHREHLPVDPGGVVVSSHRSH